MKKFLQTHGLLIFSTGILAVVYFYDERFQEEVTWVAIITLIISIHFASHRKQIATNSLEMQRLSLQRAYRQSYRSEVIGWANEVVAVMSECTILCELDPERAPNFFQQRNHLRSRLSELIDRGRWFFKNKRSGFGHWKEGAYQGIAPEILGYIKDVHKRVEELNYEKTNDNPLQRQRIVDQKRKFVSKIQKFVLPSEVEVEEELNMFS